MRQPSLQPRQNSHPNLNRQTSYSSSSSLTSSLDSPNKVSTCSTTCTYLVRAFSELLFVYIKCLCLYSINAFEFSGKSWI